MTSGPFPLEPDREEMLAIGRAALDLVVRFVDERAGAPSADLEGAVQLAEAIRAAAPPEDPAPLAEALATVERAAGKAIDTAGPGYLAYIPGGGLFTAAVGDLIAGGVNRYVNLAAIAPALTAIEANVVDWLARTFGLGGGFLTTGGSLANFSAVVAARARLGEDLTGATLYVSEQAHHSVAKAARLAGIAGGGIRAVACDDALRMDAAVLDDAVRADRAAGLRPFLAVATAGTTNTGAIDPLPAIADVCAAHGLWLHADAAYGGFFRLTERGRTRLAGIERADSITLDPHKGMFLPYGTGCLLVRDTEALRAAHAGGADYLQDLGPAGLPDFSALSPELSRDFRGLRVWLPLQLHGVGAFRRALDEKLDLAELAWQRLSAMQALDVPWRPELSTVAFRLRDGSDDDNRTLLERLNASRRIFVSSTRVGGRYMLRISVLSHRTHRDRIEEALELVRRESEAVLRTARGR